MDVSPKLLIEIIGHDGKEVINADLEEPNCYKGFHLQEVIDAALKCGSLGKRVTGVTEIEFRPVMINGDQEIEVFTEDYAIQRAMHYLNDNDCIILGMGKTSPHAVAYDRLSDMIYDPSGKIYLFEQARENHFHAMESILIISQPDRISI